MTSSQRHVETLSGADVKVRLSHPVRRVRPLGRPLNGRSGGLGVQRELLVNNVLDGLHVPVLGGLRSGSGGEVGQSLLSKLTEWNGKRLFLSHYGAITDFRRTGTHLWDLMKERARRQSITKITAHSTT